ncbi:MAG: tRNA (adenosine(37)-N6)-threonylcarbamoyltransferase complex transferase subunit TsaD, partial [Candidatus Omnitrophota bacterium]
MITLGIETSCDETAAALVEDSRVLSSEVSSSVHLHSQYGGVVPEIASRAHVEYIFPVLMKALKDSGRKIDDIDLVAVTNGPGLPGSLLVGIAFAKAISFSRDIPLLGVNHLPAHIFSCFLDEERSSIEDKFPFVGMVISGGHTSIYYCRGLKDFELIGRTKDDAVGEAFDKVAKVLGLGYPGGPVVEQRARNFSGNGAIDFPRALLQDEADLDFSFSGIKTAVLYYWQSCEHTEAEKDRICWSFQQAILDVIEKKIL